MITGYTTFCKFDIRDSYQSINPNDIRDNYQSINPNMDGVQFEPRVGFPIITHEWYKL